MLQIPAAGLPRERPAAGCWPDVAEASCRAKRSCITRSHATNIATEDASPLPLFHSPLTPELSGAAKRLPLERVVRQALCPKAHPDGWHDSQPHALGTHRPAACPMNLPMRPRTPTVHCDSLAEARRTNHKSKSYTPNT